jgi:DNA polymerase-3 subunit delta'
MPFRDIAGHATLVRILARAVARGSMPPSLVFAGPEGVGKMRTAIAVAQALNCLQPMRDAPGLETDACGVCGACRRIARGIHSDVLTIRPVETGNIGVDQIREAIDRSAYRPFEGRRRVVIVEQADALMPTAQNAFLKTLEEPPAASVFVLVTAAPDALLPTVQSRCPRLRFGPLGADEVAGVLTSGHGWTETEARAAAAAADGSVRRALDARDGDYPATREAARRALAGAIGTRDPQRLLELAKGLGVEKRGKMTAAAEREAVALRLRALASLVRDLGILSTRADDRLLANADLRPALEPLARSVDGDRVVRAFSAIDQALVALDGNASPKIVADWLVFQL